MKISKIRTTDIMISDIGIRELDIPPVRIIFDGTAPLVPAAPPVVLEVGLPVVDIPGCVEAHEKSDKNENLLEDDPKGTKTFCDGETPSYDPIQYEPERLIPTNSAPVPKTESPEKPAPEVPKAPEIKPPPEKPATVELIPEVPAPEPEIPWVEKYLPSPEAATTTAAIAVVATTSALMAKPLADLLLRVIKPTVKKIIKKISAIRGKKTPTLSVRDRRDQQRLYSHALRKLKGKE
jgi:hypothetical protein